jgi:osmotically-inducible protein OsmY
MLRRFIFLMILPLILSLGVLAFAGNTRDEQGSTEDQPTTDQNQKGITSAHTHSMTQSALAGMVQDKLKDKNADYSNIEVKDKNGTITLAGTVKSQDEIPVIIETVLEVDGVKVVDSNLVVSGIHSNLTGTTPSEGTTMGETPESPTTEGTTGTTGSTTGLKGSEKTAASNEKLEVAIHQKLKQEDPSFSNVKVEAENGNVILVGTVKNYKDIPRIVNVVLGVNDVKSVDSKLFAHGIKSKENKEPENKEQQ